MPCPKVTELCEEFFNWRLEEFPELATFCGFHERDGRLNDHSAEAFQRRVTAVEGFLSKATEIETASKLTDADSVNLLLLKQELQLFLTGTKDCKLLGYLFAVSFIDGIHIDFEQLVSWMRFETEDDYRVYLERLTALPNRVGSDLETLRQAVSIGCTHSIYSMDAVPKQLSDLIGTSAKESVFYAPFKSIPTSVDSTQLDSLKQQAIAEIEDRILPAFKKLTAYINEDYLPACRPREGVDSITGGCEFYNKCLRWHTSLDVTPQQVYDLGVAEVERIQKEMERVIKKSGFVGDFAAFVQHLRADPKFFYKTKDDCLEGFKDICYNRIRPALPKLFSKIPQSLLQIQPVPETRAGGPAAYYMNGTVDGTRPGIFYCNVQNLSLCPIYTMMTLSLHEGEPGHHFQGMYSIECHDMPRFRRYTEDMYYSHAPSKFPMHTAFCEGWALYCEYLGYELGLYEDPFIEFGHLTYEMFRACRLMADTGLHAFGWTFDQAVKLFVDNTSLHEDEIRQEVRRYITWPAQACAYKLGQLKIQELRKNAQTALGEQFSVHSFHEEVLRCGLVPLDVLEVIVDKYIDSQREEVKQ